MTEFANALLNGAGLGMVYGLVAIGIVLLFKASGVLNFAHGAFMTTGAFIAAAIAGRGHGFWLSAVFALLIMGAIGGGLYTVTLRPLATRGLFAGVMVTIGLSQVIAGVLSIGFGTGQRLLPAPVQPREITLFTGVGIPATLVLCGVVVVIAVALFAVLFRYTLFGVRLRAAAENSGLAATFGANLGVIFAVAWGMSAIMAGLAGTLLGSLSVVDLSLGDFALRAFCAVIVGGVDSISGALAGGLLVGMTEIVSATYLGSEYRLVSAMALLLIFLLLRPTGLFGQRTLQRV